MTSVSLCINPMPILSLSNGATIAGLGVRQTEEEEIRVTEEGQLRIEEDE